MGLNAELYRLDGQPLGSIENVKELLAEAFPGARFITIEKKPDVPGYERLASLLRLSGFQIREVKYPHYAANFEGEEFAVEFEIDADPIVQIVRLTFYGRGVNNASPHLDQLCGKTGWQIRYE